MLLGERRIGGGVAQPCKLCTHPDRLKADKMLIQGIPNSRVAAKFGCSETAVRRHRAHIAEVLSKGFVSALKRNSYP